MLRTLKARALFLFLLILTIPSFALADPKDGPDKEKNPGGIVMAAAPGGSECDNTLRLTNIVCPYSPETFYCSRNVIVSFSVSDMDVPDLRYPCLARTNDSVSVTFSTQNCRVVGQTIDTVTVELGVGEFFLKASASDGKLYQDDPDLSNIMLVSGYSPRQHWESGNEPYWAWIGPGEEQTVGVNDDGTVDLSLNTHDWDTMQSCGYPMSFPDIMNISGSDYLIPGENQISGTFIRKYRVDSTNVTPGSRLVTASLSYKDVGGTQESGTRTDMVVEETEIRQFYVLDKQWFQDQPPELDFAAPTGSQAITSSSMFSYAQWTMSFTDDEDHFFDYPSPTQQTATTGISYSNIQWESSKGGSFQATDPPLSDPYVMFTPDRVGLQDITMKWVDPAPPVGLLDSGTRNDGTVSVVKPVTICFHPTDYELSSIEWNGSADGTLKAYFGIKGMGESVIDGPMEDYEYLTFHVTGHDEDQNSWDCEEHRTWSNLVGEDCDILGTTVYSTAWDFNAPVDFSHEAGLYAPQQYPFINSTETLLGIKATVGRLGILRKIPGQTVVVPEPHLVDARLSFDCSLCGATDVEIASARVRYVTRGYLCMESPVTQELYQYPVYHVWTSTDIIPVDPVLPDYEMQTPVTPYWTDLGAYTSEQTEITQDGGLIVY